jgi:hypothetical protein
MTFRAEMAFMEEVPPVLVEVRRILCASSVSADSLLCHFGMEGSRPYNHNKLLPGVFLSQPSPFCAQETQHLTSSLLAQLRKDSESVVGFPLLRYAKTLIWSFLPYSTQGACQTVSGVPDLLASP